MAHSAGRLPQSTVCNILFGIHYTACRPLAFAEYVFQVQYLSLVSCSLTDRPWKCCGGSSVSHWKKDEDITCAKSPVDLEAVPETV